MPGIASFHLTKVGSGRAPLALARLGADRVMLARVPGLRFWRLLGTGRGADTGPGADLRRTALFAVWDDEAALDRFVARRTIERRGVEEAYSVRLRAVGGHGAWNRFDVLGALDRAEPAAGEPVAVITRAQVRVRHWRTFAAAAREVSGELQQAPGLLAVCGIGEAPVGRQATFSLWRSAGDARAFAHDTARHADAVRRTRAEGWYGEELFATLAPFGSSGTWDGRDPLSSRRTT